MILQIKAVLYVDSPQLSFKAGQAETVDSWSFSLVAFIRCYHWSFFLSSAAFTGPSGPALVLCFPWSFSLLAFIRCHLPSLVLLWTFALAAFIRCYLPPSQSRLLLIFGGHIRPHPHYSISLCLLYLSSVTTVVTRAIQRKQFR